MSSSSASPTLHGKFPTNNLTFIDKTPRSTAISLAAAEHTAAANVLCSTKLTGCAHESGRCASLIHACATTEALQDAGSARERGETKRSMGANVAVPYYG